MEKKYAFLLMLVAIFFCYFILKKFRFFDVIQSLFISSRRKEELNNFFDKYFYYYHKLPEKLKNRFLYRVYDLLKYINITGRQNFKVTDEVRYFVVAAQVQLTFGYKKYFLSHFRKVFIYPGSYLNKMTGNMHDGEVNTRGLIVLSWKKFLKGYAIPDDKINLGLHEMAHALMHTIIHSDKHEAGLDYFLNKIIKVSQEEIKKIKTNISHFFRDYAGTDVYEFFAVAIEHFFEDPKGLKKEIPSLYKYLTKLLKQDPANNIFVMKFLDVYRY